MTKDLDSVKRDLPVWQKRPVAIGIPAVCRASVYIHVRGAQQADRSWTKRKKEEKRGLLRKKEKKKRKKEASVYIHVRSAQQADRSWTKQLTKGQIIYKVKICVLCREVV